MGAGRVGRKEKCRWLGVCWLNRGAVAVIGGARAAATGLKGVERVDRKRERRWPRRSAAVAVTAGGPRSMADKNMFGSTRHRSVL